MCELQSQVRLRAVDGWVEGGMDAEGNTEESLDNGSIFGSIILFVKLFASPILYFCT